MGKTLDIVGLTDIGRGDTDSVGIPAAYLGEVHKAGLPIPPGFVVTTHAFARFLRESGLKPKIMQLLHTLNSDDTKNLYRISHDITQLFTAAKPSKEFFASIETAYHHVANETDGTIAVSIRPSIPVPELHDHDLQGSFFHVIGAPAVFSAILHAWAALFSPRALAAFLASGRDLFVHPYPLIVQVKVNGTHGGVIWSSNPTTGNAQEMVIRAVYGLGNSIRRTGMTADWYLISKRDSTILDRKLSTQQWSLRHEAGFWRHETVTKSEQKRQKVADADILRLAEIGKLLEEHFHAPQEIEWLMDERGRLMILHTEELVIQPRPGRQKDEPDVQPILRGTDGVIGVGVGPARIVRTEHDLRQFQRGEVLVVEKTNPALLPLMEQAAAIVTEAGQPNSHALTVGQTLGIPVVIGAKGATYRLQSGVIVTVDGGQRAVYQGKVNPPTRSSSNGRILRTKIYGRTGGSLPSHSRAVVDGLHFYPETVLRRLPLHPRYLLSEQKEHLVVRALSQALYEAAQAVTPLPVYYHLSSLATPQYRNLGGGERIEPREINPLLGYRGAVRHLREPDLLQLELLAVKTVRESYGVPHINLVLPWVRTKEELRQLTSLIGSLTESPDSTQVWLSAGIPSNLSFSPDEIQDVIQGVSIDLDQLLPLLFAIDPDSPRLSQYTDTVQTDLGNRLDSFVRGFVETHVPIVVSAGRFALSPTLIQGLVETGLSGIATDAENLDMLRELLASIEDQSRFGYNKP